MGWDGRYSKIEMFYDGGVGNLPFPNYFKRNSNLYRYRRINNSRMLKSHVMSMNARVSGETGNPVVASHNKTRSPTGRNEQTPLSPVQRIRGKIHVADPAMIRRIIFDPSLDTV